MMQLVSMGSPLAWVPRVGIRGIWVLKLLTLRLHYSLDYEQILESLIVNPLIHASFVPHN